MHRGKAAPIFDFGEFMNALRFPAQRQWLRRRLSILDSFALTISYYDVFRSVVS